MIMISFKYIHLTKGHRAKVSVDDWHWLRHFTWRADVRDHTVYAKTDVVKYDPQGNKVRSTVFMHRLITRAPKWLHVDHANNKGYDNRRENLRVLKPWENMQNRTYGRVNYRGVTMYKLKDGTKRYRARMKNTWTDKTESLGTFDTPEQAAKAYDLRAIELYGKFYGLNYDREFYGLEGAMTHPQEDFTDLPF
jgi:hypothetical protein